MRKSRRAAEQERKQRKKEKTEGKRKIFRDQVGEAAHFPVKFRPNFQPLKQDSFFCTLFGRQAATFVQ